MTGMAGRASHPETPTQGVLGIRPLSPYAVRRIRARRHGDSARALAEIFDVSERTIVRVRNGRGYQEEAYR